MRSATESVIRAEELECQEDDMNVTDDTDQMKPDFPALSAVDAMVSLFIASMSLCPRTIKEQFLKVDSTTSYTRVGK